MEAVTAPIVSLPTRENIDFPSFLPGGGGGGGGGTAYPYWLAG